MSVTEAPSASVDRVETSPPGTDDRPDTDATTPLPAADDAPVTTAYPLPGESAAAGSGGHGPGAYAGYGGPSGYGSGSHGSGGYGGPPAGGTPPTGGPPAAGPPAPSAPPRPVVPGPGARLTSAVLAVSLLVVAGLALADRTDLLGGNVWLMAGGALLLLLGLGVALAGALGRRQGALGLLGFLVAIVLVPTALLVSAVPGLARIGTDGWRSFGNHDFSPATVAVAEAGRSIGAGTIVVDLTGLDVDEDITVPVEVGMGNAEIIVPQDAGVTINAEVGAGEITGRLDDDWTTTVGNSALHVSGGSGSIASGAGVEATLEQPGRPHITVDVGVGFGQITIEEQP